LLALACSVLGAATLQARADRPEACFAVNPALPVAGSTCSYGPATVKGGIDGIGSWVVTIERTVANHGRAGKTKTATIVIRSDSLPQQCVRTGPRAICPIGTVQPGDLVTAEATEPISLVGVGNPCPAPNPGAPPPIAGGEC
jgi:hypothetical protein